jgi:hypothetical protein
VRLPKRSAQAPWLGYRGPHFISLLNRDYSSWVNIEGSYISKWRTLSSSLFEKAGSGDPAPKRENGMRSQLRKATCGGRNLSPAKTPSSRLGVTQETSMQRFTYSIAQGPEYLSIFENSSGYHPRMEKRGAFQDFLIG